MYSKYRFSHKPFELKSLKKSKFFETRRYFIPLKNKKTGQNSFFCIEFFSINPFLNTAALQFASITERKKRAVKASFVFLRLGFIEQNETFAHVFFSGKELQFDRKHKLLKIGSCVFSRDYLAGTITTQSQDTEWKINILSKDTHAYGLSLPVVLQKDKKKSQYANLCFFSNFSGTVRIGTEKYEVVEKKQLSFFDHSWGQLFVKPMFFLSSQNFISLISGKKLENSYFISTSFFNYKNKKYKHYFSLTCESQKFNFPSKNMKVLFYQKKELTQWSISAENKHYLMDIDIYSYHNQMSKIGYSFESMQRLQNEHLFNLGQRGYGELRIYKKNKKKLETLEHVRVEHCLCEQALNLPLEK